MACENLASPAITVSDDNPVVNSLVDCTFSVKNTGSSQEKFHVIFRDNGHQFYMSPVTTVEPGIVAKVSATFQPFSTGSVDICAELICDTPSIYGCGTMYNGYKIGGGEGYPIPVATRTVSAATYSALKSAIEGASSGDVVFIPGNYTINMSSQPAIKVPGGVTVASDRGKNGSLGALIIKNKNATSGWEEATLTMNGNNCRVTGLRMEGEMFPVLPDPSQYQKSENLYLVGIGQDDHSGLVVDNCELRGYAWACIMCMNKNTRGMNAVHVHHNYIHYTLARSEGYGVDIGGGIALIEGNIFNNNRHSVCAAGVNGESYTFRYNHHLGDGDAWYGHWCDVHGYSGEQGTKYEIYNNTFEHNGDWCAIGFQGSGTAIKKVYRNIFNYRTIKPIQIWGNTQNLDISDNYLNTTLVSPKNDSRMLYVW